MGRGYNGWMEGFKKGLFKVVGKLHKNIIAGVKNNDLRKRDTALCMETEKIEFRII